MTGRRTLLVLTLILGLSVQASAAPLIVQLAPLTNITSVLRILGGTLLDSIPGTNIHLINLPVVPTSLLNSLTSLLGIQWIELNQGVTMPASPVPLILTAPGSARPDWYKNQPAMQLIRSGKALAYTEGHGVIVADLNSQIDFRHPGLVGRLTTGFDFVAAKQAGSVVNENPSGFMHQSSASFMDQSSASFMDGERISILNQSSASFMDGNPAYSHGTLTAGVIAVVAPESMIMPLRVFDEKGSADLFTIAKAVRYAVQNGAHVINMSFGTLENSQAIKSAINYALSKNVVLVASAGNNNTTAPQYPAAYSGVITTAATDIFDKKASFSNYGSNVYVDAPGVNIFSSYPDGRYSMVSGTSFSAPIIAGTVALIRSQRASVTANDIAAAAIDIDSKNPKYVRQLGHGRIDVLKAVQAK